MNRLTLAGKQVPLKGKPVTVTGRTVTPNGLADAVFDGGAVKGIGHLGPPTQRQGSDPLDRTDGGLL